jgi:hypothetical protein
VVLAMLVVPSVRQRTVMRQRTTMRQARRDAGPETGTFHDREGFTTPGSIKSFAIMETSL